MAEAEVFALHAGDGSIVFERTSGDQLCWRHWGGKVDPRGLPPLATSRARRTFSFDQEVPLTLLPTSGLGWFGPPGVTCRRGGRVMVLDLACTGIEATDERITVRLGDPANGIDIVTVIETSGAGFAFNSTLRNVGHDALELDWLASAVLPLPPQCSRLVSFTGRHNREMIEHSEPMPVQQWARESRLGLSGHGGPPALLALAATADWHSGEVWALQLAWSGDHSLRVEPDREGGWYLTAGAGLNPGEIVLAPGEAFEAPGLFACFSTAGRNGVVAGFHERIRARVTWPGGARRPRPVHFNSWESVYFAHDEARMIQLARAAAELGVERFVVDDGWFAGRDGDDAGLGDWVPDPQRYPRGLGPLAREVTNLGMEFGLWIEPEMVNVNSDLYRAHPEWVLGSVLARPLPMARHQLVLDMARADVRDHLFAAITALLSELPVAYLKWDHNRALAPAVRADGAAGTYAHIRGVWELWDRVRAAFPDVEIEACAAGGGRIDAGFAARAHRFWASDNIDALSRVELQRGFLQFMPPEMMGAHVGASPAHATGRPQAMDFSAMIALPGHFGIECDPGKLSDLERQRLRSWIAIYKSLRERFHHGRCWLGETPGGLVWQAHGSPQDLLLLVTRTAPAVHGREAPLRLPMLPSRGAVRAQLLEAAGLPRAHQPANLEILRGEGVIMPAGWIASHGLPLPHLGGMGAALFRLKSI